LSITAHRLLRLAFHRADFRCFTFVVEILTFCQGDLKFRKSGTQIQPQWDNRIPVQFGLGKQFDDLPAVKKQLAVTVSIVIVVGAESINSDMKSLDPGFPFAERDVGILERSFTVSQRFDLRTLQDQSGLVGIFDEIIVLCFLISCDLFNCHMLIIPLS